MAAWLQSTNPLDVPYTSKLEKPLVVGQTITVNGDVHKNAKRVEVNVLAGGDDIGPGEAVLHASFRFNEKALVLNSYLNGAWGAEERAPLNLKPFEKFELRFRILDDAIQITANDAETTFAHRAPFESVEYFQVKGDCTLSDVQYGEKTQELPTDTGFEQERMPEEMEEGIRQPREAQGDIGQSDIFAQTGPMGDTPHDVPYTAQLEAPLVVGQTILLFGDVNPNANRMEVNLLASGNDIGPGQAVLHASFRFPQQMLVLNSCLGQWDKEERLPLTLKPGERYDLCIRVLEDKYELTANGQEIGAFAHRAPFESVDFFQLKGDCTLGGVRFGGRSKRGATRAAGEKITIPYEAGFEGGHLNMGGKVHLYAVMKGDRFHVEFMGANGDVLFHFNPRLDKQKVIRNSYKGRKWQHEERNGPFAFQLDGGNDISLVNDTDVIQMLVDNELIATFVHRTEDPANDYVGLRIAGEAEVSGLEIENY